MSVSGAEIEAEHIMGTSRKIISSEGSFWLQEGHEGRSGFVPSSLYWFPFIQGLRRRTTNPCVCVCATFTSMYTQLLINRIKFISLWRITIRLLSEHRLITICFQVFWACTVRIVYCKTVIDQCEGFANALLVDWDMYGEIDSVGRGEKASVGRNVWEWER